MKSVLTRLLGGPGTLVILLASVSCGGNPPLAASTACTVELVCQQWDYDLTGEELPAGFDLNERINAMQLECAANGGIASETCSTEARRATCVLVDEGIDFTTAWYDPDLDDGDLCTLQTGCESGGGTFAAPDLVCTP